MSNQHHLDHAGPGKSRRQFIRRAAAAGAAASAGSLTGSAQAQSQTSAGVSGFDHVAVPMQNTEAMVSFYRALGMVVREETRICSVHFGDHKINFHRPETWQSPDFTLRAPSGRPPCGDFCFVWTGTAGSLAALLEQAGAEIIEGPVTRSGGRAGGTVRGTSHYTRDPDGNLLEFIIYA